jgi:hypothetical protein
MLDDFNNKAFLAMSGGGFKEALKYTECFTA